MAWRHWERYAPVTGVLFVALVVAGLVVAAGEAPGPGASADEVAAYFVDDRSRVLASTILHGLSAIFFLWFLGSLAARLRELGEERLATIAYGAGVVTLVFGSLVHVVTPALAYRIAARADAGVVQALYDVEWALVTYSFFAIAALAAATSIAALRSRTFPEWYGWLALVASLAFVFGGGALARVGFYSPAGTYVWIVFIVFLGWVFATSLHLLVERSAEHIAGAPAVQTH